MREQGTTLIAGMKNAALAFYDSTLETDCEVMRFDDGVLRCVPWDISGAIGNTHEFNDAACTVPIRRCAFLECIGLRSYDREIDPASCGSEAPVTALWTVREPATAYYRNDGGSCVSGGAVAPDQWLVDMIDPSTLATVEQHAAE
jgi:hypothetical protein